MEFRQGVCGWVNSRRGSKPWKRSTKREMESLTYLKPGYEKAYCFFILIHTICLLLFNNSLAIILKVCKIKNCKLRTSNG